MLKMIKSIWEYIVLVTKYILIPALVIVSVVIILCTLYFKLQALFIPEKFALHSDSLKDYITETDLASLFTALITFAIVIFITFRLERDSRKRQIAEKQEKESREKEKQDLEAQRDSEHEALMKQIKETVDKEFKKLTDTTTTISQITKNIDKVTQNFEDSTRKILNSADDILIAANGMLKSLNDPDNDKLHILNYTSAFGLIHTFNLHLIEDISTVRREQGEDSYFTLTFPQSVRYLIDIYLVFKRRLMEKGGSFKNFKLITYNNSSHNTLTDEFLVKFLNTYREKLFFYDFEKSDFEKQDYLDSHQQIIIENMVQQHNEIIEMIKTGRRNKKDWQYNTMNMPLQMFLISYKQGAEQKYESLVIFVGDKSLETGGLLAIYSKLAPVYHGYESMFVDILDKSEKIQ